MASYVVTQADVDRGSIVNTATVQGTPPVGGPVGDTDTNTVPFTQIPALAITKTGDVGPVTIGDTVHYTIAVSNVGNVTLHNVTVSDPKLGFSDTLPTLGVGLTATYNLTYGPVSESDLPGPIQNTATADSDETTPVSDGHSVAITASPGITVDKTAPAGPYTVGNTITYSFLVTNTGDVTLHEITVSDPLVGLSAISGYATTLAPGASTTGTASYVVTQADVDRGSIVNTATVAGTPPVGGPVDGTDTNRVPLGQIPALAITKTGDVGPVTMGGTVHYTIAVSNVGNVTLHNVTVVDPKLGFADTLPTLGVGLTATYNLTYGPVSESDLPGPIQNTATADSDETTPVSDGHSVAITASPGITVDKTAPAGPYAVGDTITYSFLVTNTGDVTLHGITVTDPLVGLSAISGYATTLAPGASTTGTASYVVTQADVDRGSVVNTATVAGTPPVGAPVGDTDTNTVPFGQTPALAIVKTGDAGPVTIGDFIHYTIVVSNVGNVTLHGVVVDDITARLERRDRHARRWREQDVQPDLRPGLRDRPSRPDPEHRDGGQR